MMAGLPAEVRDKVHRNPLDAIEPFWLDDAYEQYYSMDAFHCNPWPDNAEKGYGAALPSFTVTDIVIIIDELMQERQDG